MAGQRDEDRQQPATGVKSVLRREARQARAALARGPRAVAEQEVAGALLALPELERARRVLCYAAVGDELSLDPVAAALLGRGATVCLPRVRGPAFDAVPVTSLDQLAPAWRGVREPPADVAALDPAALDVVLVPGLAFDRRGHRLGYGGGHYDRFLAGLAESTVTVGVAFAIQLVELLPDEAHDHPVHLVVTEAATVRTR